MPQAGRPKEYLISIVPREEIDKQSFSQAFLALNKATFQPNKLWLYPMGEKEVQVFEFTGIQPNKPMDNTWFSPTTKLAGWKVIFNPGGDARPAQGPGGESTGPRQSDGGLAGPAYRPPDRSPGMRCGREPSREVIAESAAGILGDPGRPPLVPGRRSGPE